MTQPPKQSAGEDRQKIIVDIMVTLGRRIIALRPIDQSIYIDPISARKKQINTNSISPDRMNNRIRGRLIGKSFEEAIDLVNKYGSISKPGEYGSIYLTNPLDFIED
ncbi:MAG TPA: hypothetical protein VH796_15590 [Nitrososphaeraceae archaeon]|jgi:hypothetical protein